MKRRGDRAGGGAYAVQCPGCGQYVVPSGGVLAGKSDRAPGARGWSSLWQGTGGDFCPNCDFPLSRYAARIGWIRLLFVGIVLLMLQPLFFVLALMGALHGWFAWLVAGTATAGLGGVILALVGITIGGPVKRRSEP